MADLVGKLDLQPFLARNRKQNPESESTGVPSFSSLSSALELPAAFQSSSRQAYHRTFWRGVESSANSPTCNRDKNTPLQKHSALTDTSLVHTVSSTCHWTGVSSSPGSRLGLGVALAGPQRVPALV